MKYDRIRTLQSINALKGRSAWRSTKVVAARDGVVTQVRALEGQPMVRAGDAVQTGDTLISGLVEPTREGGKYRTAHAHGTVQAYTTHTVQAARPLTEQSKRYTGKIRHQYALVMGNKRLNFYIGSGITSSLFLGVNPTDVTT